MWSAISKIFTSGVPPKEEEDHCQRRAGGKLSHHSPRPSVSIPEMDDSKQAKQRASVKWLLSKAFNNKVPENLREPFYRDHENQEHLKPQIVGALANAEIYCLALGNIYSDPNYQNLNHWAILQTLARKGVYMTEPSDGATLTETTLIQTNPLRMSAHMSVIESIMMLYAREVVTSDRVLAAVQRFSYGRRAAPPVPENHERGLLLWMSNACDGLTKRVEQESNDSTNEKSQRRLPEFPPVTQLSDLVDGVALAALISYYCCDELPWSDIKVSQVPNVQDSLYNLSLVQDFCERCLPANIFHLQPEDVTYMRDSMKHNVIVFLADLFNVIEIHPAKCVKYPGIEKIHEEGFPPRNEHGVAHKRHLPQTVMTPIPDLRSGLDASATTFQVNRSTTPNHHVPLRKTNSLTTQYSDMTEDSLYVPKNSNPPNNTVNDMSANSPFVVHRGKNIPTLRSVVQQQHHPNQSKQSAAEEAEHLSNVAAGKPSHWEEHRRGGTFAGRRSRRNSVNADDSQLTIENFGGSQDNLNFIGRNPDKEFGIVGGVITRKISAPAPSFPVATVDSNTVPVVPVRSTLQDARGSIQLGYHDDDDMYTTSNNNVNISKLKRQLSSDDISLRKAMYSTPSELKENVGLNDTALNNKINLSDFTRNNNKPANDVKMVYMMPASDQSSSHGNVNNNSGKPVTNGGPTTTWQQQCSSTSNQVLETESGGDSSNQSALISAAQLNDVRLKLEEKRRWIESEKRRVEMANSQQRQQVGKAAFLQAVSKGKGIGNNSQQQLKTPPDVDTTTSPEPVPPASTTSTETTQPIRTDTASKSSTGTVPQRPFTLQEIHEDVSAVERKWLDDTRPFIDPTRTPDLENMDLERYQHSIAQMNSSLNDIQSDIQRLASQQNQMQAAQQQQHQQQQQQQHHQQQQQQNTLMSQPMYNNHPQMYHPVHQQQYSPNFGNNTLQTSASAPHIPQTLFQQQQQFFLHQEPQVQPQVPPRRTWAQHAAAPSHDYLQQQAPPQPLVTWGSKMPTQSPQSSPFVLHQVDTGNQYQNGGGGDYHQSFNAGSNSNRGTPPGSATLSQQHLLHQQHGTSHSTPSASPQHRVHRQISQLLDTDRRNPVSLQDLGAGTGVLERSLSKKSIIHAPIPAPSADDMEPQNISFIGNSRDVTDDVNQHVSDDDRVDELTQGLGKLLNITSGSRTYRIPSPTRPLITKTSFQQPPPDAAASVAKGFYIQFDDEQPKRPKPPLRTKRGSPKKERSFVNVAEESNDYGRAEHEEEERRRFLREKENREREREKESDRLRMMTRRRDEASQDEEEKREREKVAAASALIIENENGPSDPDLAERRKKRILMASLQRKQEQEEAKARKEQEAQTRREMEKAKEEEKLRRKEEQSARRSAILEQYKLKKAMEEAEREGKVFDKGEIMASLRPNQHTQPRMRPKGPTRPRPKTIHIDSGSVELAAAEGMMASSSRGKKGSTSNLTAHGSTMKRDYYRGSQDSLADRSMSSGTLYRDSPDDSRMSPCHSANQTLGRRSSYKTTSRDPSPASQTRGRPKYANQNQNFKGRKSSSLMNLYGSSTDQDSSLAYRYGDTDSGLGRATPPRRAPSPGMRHLTSPSGPGSLPPGLMSKGSSRGGSRTMMMFDDASSDISSSSMMDYNGPRLYKQPATKSNRGIMLNAVEYCVFPGVVNREAKKRVLEEINRSDCKHFLILFRDAGCQFRALYSYYPDREEVTKLYGTGPKQVNDRMFDKFFKYNSGGKCFSQIHTKHLTVTIDAFTIHNSLWQGKKVNLPNKKDMALVI